MPDGSELRCPRCNVPLKEVRTSGSVFHAFGENLTTNPECSNDEEMTKSE
jgi:hypothetical protein